MKKTFYFLQLLSLALFVMILMFSCSDKREILQVPTHPDGWLKPASDEFHGKVVVETDPEDCQACHGKNYQGGTSGVSCFSCHELYPHPQGFAAKSAHGADIVAKLFNTTDCTPCHGDNFQGGTSMVSCYECHSLFPHFTGWLNEDSPNFHGNIVLNDTVSLEDCKNCHGEDFTGGSSKVSCFTCHNSFPHPDGFANPDVHGKFIKTQANWNIVDCQVCHGTDYSGEGVEAKNCLRCHTEPSGPEACNTCHGSQQNFAPPKDLNGNTETTFIGVGAHQPHLQDSTWTTAYLRDCQLCHKPVNQFADANHVDDGTPHAEVIFGNEATDNGAVNPSWNHEAADCNNVYCHGSFVFEKDKSENQWGFAFGETEIRGNNPAMLWTAVGTGQDSCGTCHSLPPKGHIGPTEFTPEFKCSLCHGEVVDENFNIINKDLHINGQIEMDVSETEVQEVLDRVKIKQK